MAYYIRNRAGEAKAKATNEVANQIINGCQGHFREAVYRGGSKTVFELDADMTFGTSHYKILLWRGDILEPSDK